jgi:rod shape determining protein RodA
MSRGNSGISKGVDMALVWLYLLLAVIGIMAIFGATYREGDPVIPSFFSFKTDYSKQLYYFLIGAVIGIFILLTDSKFFTATANLWYAVGIFLLLLVFPFHSRVKGTESIIRFGGFQFQPAEFCKICVCLVLGKYLSLPDQDFTKSRSQLIASGLVLLPAAMAQMQHETGLALVYLSFFIVMYREGLSPTVLIIGFSIAALVVATIVMNPNTLAFLLTALAVIAIIIMRKQIRRRKSIFFSIAFFWIVCVGIQRFAVPFVFKHVMKNYQTERIFSLFGKENPYAVTTDDDETDIDIIKKRESKDYNVKQSKIAIGSGGIAGKGLLKGTQTRYSFVPEQRTDFIFCTIGEGFGFIGTTAVLGIYLILLFRIVTVAERQRSVFSRCYAYGVASVLFFHIVINVCMTVGLAPVIGITLPLISYGGTSVITFTILLFILIRLDADRQMVLR